MPGVVVGTTVGSTEKTSRMRSTVSTSAEFPAVTMRPCLCASVACFLNGCSEHQPRLQLKHARRIDVRERWNRVSVRADAAGADELSKTYGGRCCIALKCHSPGKHVFVVENVEAFEAQLQTCPRP